MSLAASSNHSFIEFIANIAGIAETQEGGTLKQNEHLITSEK